MRESVLEQANAFLVTPLLTFNPAFTLLVAWLTLREIPGLHEALGVVIILLGSYLLEVEAARTGLLAPLAVLVQRPGAMFAILASALWASRRYWRNWLLCMWRPKRSPGCSGRNPADGDAAHSRRLLGRTPSR